MSIHIRHFHYVIAAADHGSFRRAAIALGVQESAVSRRIRQLEERLGTTFFIRSSRGVELTQAGKKFVLRGRKALSEINRSERGAERAAFIYTLIVTARMNEIDPQAWPADTLTPATKHLLCADIASTRQSALADLLPWNWKSSPVPAKAA